MVYGKEGIQENLQMEVLVSLAKDGNWKSQKEYKEINTCMSSNIKLTKMFLE
jgi:hypothetical protein